MNDEGITSNVGLQGIASLGSKHTDTQRLGSNGYRYAFGERVASTRPCRSILTTPCPAKKTRWAVQFGLFATFTQPD